MRQSTDVIRMTAEQFFQLVESNQPTELIEGEVIVSPSPIVMHQRISRQLVALLLRVIPNGELFFAPMDVYFDAQNVLQPDVIWVAENSQCTIGEKYLDGPPDLLVEIFSPGTIRQDKITKFKLYERFGVREYWLVDPIEQYIEVYRLEDEQFLQQGIYEPGNMFESVVLNNHTILVEQIFMA